MKGKVPVEVPVTMRKDTFKRNRISGYSVATNLIFVQSYSAGAGERNKITSTTYYGQVGSRNAIQYKYHTHPALPENHADSIQGLPRCQTMIPLAWHSWQLNPKSAPQRIVDCCVSRIADCCVSVSTR